MWVCIFIFFFSSDEWPDGHDVKYMIKIKILHYALKAGRIETHMYYLFLM